MKLFDSELQYISELYEKIDRELTSLLRPSPEGEEFASVEHILRNRDLFNRIEQANSRLPQVIHEWEKFCGQLDPTTRRRTECLAHAVLGKANALQDLCARLVELLQARCAQIDANLHEVGRGALYLESIRPIKANYPKFLDSLG